jgi:hypothetical protein
MALSKVLCEGMDVRVKRGGVGGWKGVELDGKWGGVGEKREGKGVELEGGKGVELEGIGGGVGGIKQEILVLNGVLILRTVRVQRLHLKPYNGSGCTLSLTKKSLIDLIAQMVYCIIHQKVGGNRNLTSITGTSLIRTNRNLCTVAEVSLIQRLLQGIGVHYREV